MMTNCKYRIGQMLLTGTGTEKDLVKATEYFELSARLGNCHAQYQLAKIYLADEDASAEKIHIAIHWLTKSAEGENQFAQYTLAKLYRDGTHVEKNEIEALLSKSLGSRTVLSGSVSRGKNDPSQSLQMMERPLMTADELKSLPKGNFIVTKTGANPMRTRLRLFLDWGITFGKPYEIEEKSHREVHYADRVELVNEIMRKYPPHESYAEDNTEPPIGAAHRSRGNSSRGGGQLHTPDPETAYERQEREFSEQRDCEFDDVIGSDFDGPSEVNR